MRKNAWQKALLAEIISSDTCVPQKWIAENLQMGTCPYVSRLSREMRSRLEKEKWLKELRQEIIKIIT